ncbi:MAG: superoxide dismutase [Alphaproteobacteria bacterium]|nr:superoxide dismutase [Alphaproteobacteria bacterium]
MPITLPSLPYAPDALAPVISKKTVDIHYGKHHKTYVDNVNRLIEGTGYATLSLIDIVQKTSGQPDKTTLFNNAAQAWNHTFFWESLTPGGGRPSAKLASLIDRDLGGYDKFRTDFIAAATSQFGSGWAWLVAKDGALSIQKTGNAETPITDGGTPLLTIDVWEHAYYLDYQNRRADFVTAVVDNLLNWERANDRLGA